jgi:hypothetical protein
MKFKTLIPAILALIIGLHALPALAGQAAVAHNAGSMPVAMQERVSHLDAGAVARQLKEEQKRTGK